MKLFSILVVCFAAFCGGAQAAKVLALLENLAVKKETHSMFFKQLADAGLEVTFKIADDPSIVIKKDGKNLYDHLIIFSPTVEDLGGSLSVEAIVEFIEEGGNVLMDGFSSTGDVLREMRDILTESSFTYSHNPEDPITEYPHATGKNIVLIAGLQARNNARVIFSGNADLDKALSAWWFQMAGVVRNDSVEHHLASSSTMKKDLVAQYSHFQAIFVKWFLLYTLWREYEANHISLFKYASFFMTMLITCVASFPICDFLNDTSDNPILKLVELGAILISSGLFLLLPGPSSTPPVLPGPSSTPPVLPYKKSPTTISIAMVLVGFGVEASVTSAAATAFVSGNSFLKICIESLVAFLGMVLGEKIKFDRAILLIIFMEVVAVLLVLIFIF